MDEDQPQDRDAIIRSIIAEVVRAEIRHSNSARKNGESLMEWANKPGTKQLAILVFAALSFVFSFGQQFNRYTEGVDALIEQTEVLTGGQAQLRADVDALVKRHEELLQRVQSHATRADVERLREDMKLLVTRAEMRGAFRQELLPRLEKIERQLAASR